MPKSRTLIILIVALLLAGSVASLAQTVAPQQDEPKLIAVLKNADASQKEKVDACRQLAIIGTKDAVAPLAALLGDEKLSHMARYALEPIRDPAVDAALRDAMGKLKGMPLVGVITSIGVRRDPEAVQPLMGLLMQNQAGPYAIIAALRALGQIGTPAAAEVLKTSLDHAPPEGMPDVYEGLFRCAERFAAEGNRGAAIEIYDTLRARDASHQVRAGALRGAILTRGSEGVALLREHLRSDDYILFSAACQTALEMPGPEVTQALTAELSELPADNQILVIWTLGKRGDTMALSALFALAQKGEPAVRLEAIRAMPVIDDASAVPVLVELSGNSDAKISQAAQDSLAALSGEQTDAAIMAMLESGQSSQRLTALDLIGRRRMTKSVPVLLKAARGTDAQVRPAAIRRVGELGSVKDMPALLEVLMAATQREDLDAAERALSAVCIKTDDPQSQAGKLTSLLARAKPEQKAAMLRVLSVVGGQEALTAVRAAAKDTNSQVSDAAVRALCSWKTAEAAPDLLSLAKTSSEPSRKTAALQGYINLVRDEGLSTEQKLAMCKQAAAMITRAEDKKLLLGALGTVPSAEALAMAMTYVDDAATKAEACFAAVAISGKIVDQNPQQVTDALQKVLNATNNKNVIKIAEQTLQKARKGAGR
jgi:HEAT repeat protein